MSKVSFSFSIYSFSLIFSLLYSDLQESFLEDINCILNSGEVPDLFDNEEMDGICVELRQVAAQAGIPDTRTDVYNFFIKVRRRNINKLSKSITVK